MDNLFKIKSPSCTRDPKNCKAIHAFFAAVVRWLHLSSGPVLLAVYFHSWILFLHVLLATISLRRFALCSLVGPIPSASVAQQRTELHHVLHFKERWWDLRGTFSAKYGNFAFHSNVYKHFFFLVMLPLPFLLRSKQRKLCCFSFRTWKFLCLVESQNILN